MTDLQIIKQIEKEDTEKYEKHEKENAENMEQLLSYFNNTATEYTDLNNHII